MDVVDKAGGVVAGAAHGVAEDQRDQEDPNGIVPVKQLEAIVLHALIGIGPGSPADGARDHHQQRDTQAMRCEHGFSLNSFFSS